MKKKIISILILLIVSITCFSLYACNEQPPTAFKKQENKGYSMGFSRISEKVLDEEDPEDNAILESKGEHYTKDDPYYDEDYDVTFRKVTATTSYEDLCTFGANSDIFYPGAMIDGVTKSPIEIDRAPLTIRLEGIDASTLPVGVNLNWTIEDPTMADVKDGVQNLVSTAFQHNPNIASQLYMDIIEVESEEEFNLGLGFEMNFRKFYMDDQFNYKKGKKQTNIAVVLKQVYFDVEVSRQNKRGEYQFFSEDLSNNYVRGLIGDEKIPLYCNKVSYGRIAVINISTNYSYDEIYNKLAVGYGQNSDSPGKNKTKGFSTELETEFENLVKNKETKISAFVYGGGDETTYGLMNVSNLSDIVDVFRSTASTTSVCALPIFYSFRHLNGDMAYFQNCNDYYVKDVTYNPKYLTDWTWLDTMINDESIRELETLKINFLGMGNSVNANRTVSVPANIEELILYGGNDLYGDDIVFQNLSFDVSHRSTPIKIVLDNITINGYTHTKTGNQISNYTPKPFIACDENIDIIIEALGDVCIRGGEGKPAIQVKNLTITGDANLEIHGGNGKDGVSGSDELAKNGVNGASALDCENIIIKDMTEISKIYLYGGNGGNGAKGNDQELEYSTKNPPSKTTTNGGCGGNGGYAIDCDTMTVLEAIKIYIRGGNGGDGGNGGSVTVGGNYGGGKTMPSGADGGNGGNGGSPISAEIELTMSNNVKLLSIQRGNGGNGGIGGDGGDSVFDKDSGAWPEIGGNGGRGGNGGFGFIGGRGGNGGQGGDTYDNKQSGDGGYAGDGGDSFEGLVCKNGAMQSSVGEAGLGGLGGKAGYSTRGGSRPGIDRSNTSGVSGIYVAEEYEITFIEE